MDEITDSNQKVLVLHWGEKMSVAQQELLDAQKRVAHWTAKVDEAKAELDRVLVEVKDSGGPEITADELKNIDAKAFTNDPSSSIKLERKSK